MVSQHCDKNYNNYSQAGQPCSQCKSPEEYLRRRLAL